MLCAASGIAAATTPQRGRAPTEGTTPGAGARPSPATPPRDGPPPLPARDQPPPLPDRPPPPPSVMFHVERGGAAEGPFTLNDVAARIQAGQITRDTLVWKRGTPAWQRAGEVQELAALFGAAPPEQTVRDFRQLMVGAWHIPHAIQGPMGRLNVMINIRCTPDGQYTGIMQSQVGPGGPVSMPIAGTWSTTPLSDRQFALTLTSGYTSDTYTFEVLDRNTLRNEGVGMLARRVGR
ncbi:DUF4339 domain-containing protein [Elioraea sp.]|uniref:DUF4339 domain-containing protein n=1 Tax=Elioraea sp. TaxID=2185103 RepID=UPI003F6F2722